MEKFKGIQLIQYDIFKKDVILEEGAVPSFFLQGLIEAVVRPDADGTRFYYNNELIFLLHSPRMLFETIRAKGITEEEHQSWVYYNV